MQIAGDNGDGLDEKFGDLFKELMSEIDSHLTTNEYIDFYAETCTTESAIDSEQVDCRKASRKACIEEHLW